MNVSSHLPSSLSADQEAPVATASETLSLKHGFAFEDLYDRQGLVRLDQAFVEYLKASDVELFNRLMAARAGAALPTKEASELIIAVAPHLDDFIGDLFGIAEEVRDLQEKHSALVARYVVKRKFVHKKAARSTRPTTASGATTRARTAARPA
jgi:hypothetical protein